MEARNLIGAGVQGGCTIGQCRGRDFPAFPDLAVDLATTARHEKLRKRCGWMHRCGRCASSSHCPMATALQSSPLGSSLAPPSSLPVIFISGLADFLPTRSWGRLQQMEGCVAPIPMHSLPPDLVGWSFRHSTRCSAALERTSKSSHALNALRDDMTSPIYLFICSLIYCQKSSPRLMTSFTVGRSRMVCWRVSCYHCGLLRRCRGGETHMLELGRVRALLVYQRRVSFDNTAGDEVVQLST